MSLSRSWPFGLLALSALLACDGEGAADAGLVTTDEDAGTAGDGGRDAGAPVDAGPGFTELGGDCRRTAIAATLTADIGLLDGVRTRLSDAGSPAEKDALVAAFFAELEDGGGTPLRDRQGSSRVAFVARDAPGVGYSVSGTFNGWDAGVNPLFQVEGSTLYATELSLPRLTAHAYKMVDGTGYYEDRRAANVQWDGLSKAGPGEFNAVVHPELLPVAAGRVVAHRQVPSATLSDARDVFVYLPPAYDAPGCPQLPSLYFQDGNEALTHAPFSSAADGRYGAVPSDSAVLVFVALPNQGIRLQQYSPYVEPQVISNPRGAEYVTFLADELVPRISSRYRVCAAPRDRGLTGASMGGLISHFGGMQRPEVFGYVGAQSASYFIGNNALIGRVQSSAAAALRVYLDAGCWSQDLSRDNCDVTRLMRDALAQKSYPHRHVEEVDARHEWGFWQTRLPGLLGYFREGHRGCE